ncbi:ribosome maturation factor RimM [Paraferrimonas sedimenticola]|uniref:Ribosome maturation factor RimM n=1 Tax=Paraferrimonas sedimenticola TaxID=375674 RepID=A0AA37RZ34_9GAMM|nr:ribosome maturation factor RimM [Paraferrimonas sedimenticola]GLP97177.1 ribosome maturation factor RimM [Paraferrimonas sedimenticola]
MADQEMVVLGKLGSVYGVKGWLRVNSFTDDAEGIFEYAPWYLKVRGQWQQVEIANWRAHNKGPVVQLKGTDGRDAAQQLVNCEIGVSADQLQDLPEDEFYWRDLIGCEVINAKGYHMGKVDDILETGSNDVLRVRANAKDAFGQKERLIPFVTEQFILEVNLDSRQITVDWEPDF